MSDSRTVVFQIGNSDDKLTQKDWSLFCEALRETVVLYGRIYFVGCSAGDASWQNYCIVLEIEDKLWQDRNWESWDEFLETVIKKELAALATVFKQDSIAVTMGETIFVTSHIEE